MQSSSAATYGDSDRFEVGFENQTMFTVFKSDDGQYYYEYLKKIYLFLL